MHNMHENEYRTYKQYVAAARSVLLASYDKRCQRMMARSIFRALWSNYTVCQVQPQIVTHLDMACLLVQTTHSVLEYHHFTGYLFCPTSLWYTYVFQLAIASSTCNCCMQYRTVLPLSRASFVLANKRILANKRKNLWYCCHKHICLLTRIYGIGGQPLVHDV